jgi:hypothetical protein
VGRVQLGIRFELENPVTPPEAAFLALAWFSRNIHKGPLASEWQDRNQLRSAVESYVPALTN